MKDNFPYYVGVSRSGSHWLRLVLENYMDGKSPLSNFLSCTDSPNQLMSRINEFRGTHDMKLDFKSDYVIYLYRNPIDCIYSNLKYDGTNINDIKAIDYYLDIWEKHITKWVYDEKFTKKKVIVCYENLQDDFIKEFSKVLNFLGLEINEKKIEYSKNLYTKNKIKEIVHDKKVINSEPNYEMNRDKFINLHGKYIYSKLPELHKSICKFPQIIF